MLLTYIYILFLYTHIFKIYVYEIICMWDETVSVIVLSHTHWVQDCLSSQPRLLWSPSGPQRNIWLLSAARSTSCYLTLSPRCLSFYYSCWAENNCRWKPNRFTSDMSVAIKCSSHLFYFNLKIQMHAVITAPIYVHTCVCIAPTCPVPLDQQCCRGCFLPRGGEQAAMYQFLSSETAS